MHLRLLNYNVLLIHSTLVKTTNLSTVFYSTNIYVGLMRLVDYSVRLFDGSKTSYEKLHN